ncbi:MAG: hypothetical protein LBR79_02520 [Oscillospiraceae bacterium]|jgi:hypothetical protein|nr:hypothetical protein [Oscillospiraceae bacterium]
MSPPNIEKVQPNELPRYVQKIVKCSYQCAISREDIDPLLECDRRMLIEIKVLRKLIGQQTFTFREISFEKLYQRTDNQCDIIVDILSNFLTQYKKVCTAYFSPVVIITNIKDLDKLFLSLRAYYEDCLKLIERIKSKKIWEQCHHKFDDIDFKWKRGDGNGHKSVKIFNLIQQGIIEPIFLAATTIVANEKALKKKTHHAQRFFEENAKQLKVVTEKVVVRIEQGVLYPCSWLIANSGAAVEGQKGKKIEMCSDSIPEIDTKTSLLKLKLKNIKKIVEQILKSIKYCDDSIVGLLVTLKSLLKEMVNLANEVFEILKDPNTTEEQRKTKIISVTKKIKELLNDIETVAEKVKWDENRPEEMGQNALKINKEFYKVLEKLENLNDNPNIAKLQSTMAQLNTSKPHAIITFVAKYGKYIITALGILAALL